MLHLITHGRDSENIEQDSFNEEYDLFVQIYFQSTLFFLEFDQSLNNRHAHCTTTTRTFTLYLQPISSKIYNL